MIKTRELVIFLDYKFSIGRIADRMRCRNLPSNMVLENSRKRFVAIGSPTHLNVTAIKTSNLNEEQEALDLFRSLDLEPTIGLFPFASLMLHKKMMMNPYSTQFSEDELKGTNYDEAEKKYWKSAMLLTNPGVAILGQRSLEAAPFSHLFTAKYLRNSYILGAEKLPPVPEPKLDVDEVEESTVVWSGKSSLQESISQLELSH